MNKDLNFECIEDFTYYIVEKVEEDKELFVSVIGKFEEIKNIIKEMFYIAEVDFDGINIESPIVDGYEDEYVLDCWCCDGVIRIGCEPAKRDGEYLNLIGDETYLLEDCSSKIISLCEGSDLYFVNINAECDYDEEYDCDDCCDECCRCDCHDDKDDNYVIRVKFDLDVDETMEIIDKLESRMFEMNKFFKEMNNVKNLFGF